jgi:hypothetical protein
MSLLAILNEQTAFGFTGRINILLKTNDQLYGVIFQYEGKIVGAISGNQKGRKTLFHLVFQEVDSIDKFKLIVEPEVIGPASFMFDLSFGEVRAIAEKQFPEFLNAKKLRPPPHLKLLINPEIICNEAEITPAEFQVLETLTEYSSVNDVYQNSKLLEFEITNALVSLRKKMAIKVLNN